MVALAMSAVRSRNVRALQLRLRPRNGLSGSVLLIVSKASASASGAPERPAPIFICAGAYAIIWQWSGHQLTPRGIQVVGAWAMFSRRQSTSVGASLIAAPFLNQLNGVAYAQGVNAPAKRLLVFFTPDGIISFYWPEGTENDWRIGDERTGPVTPQRRSSCLRGIDADRKSPPQWRACRDTPMSTWWPYGRVTAAGSGDGSTDDADS